MRWVMPVLMVGVLFSCCSVAPSSEWRWDEVDARTMAFEIPVTFPSWLEPEDREKVLAAIDDYWALMLEMVPEARVVDVTTYTIHIHDNLGAFWVPAAKCWCHGWQCGHHIQIAWSWDMSRGVPGGHAVKNPLHALCHEWLHIIVDMTWGWEDPAHIYFPMYQAQLDLIGTMAPEVHLSELSIIKMRLYRYIPQGLGGPSW